ncbi:piggyBac transposable element-derived protein 4-like [Asterias amurensis]|uniref:piggyBac transposable element-derived protein 4-like n=1 Tax=Asterias amurensis TaxID=7602 RepID=UPI003AB8058C
MAQAQETTAGTGPQEETNGESRLLGEGSQQNLAQNTDNREQATIWPIKVEKDYSNPEEHWKPESNFYGDEEDEEESLNSFSANEDEADSEAYNSDSTEVNSSDSDSDERAGEDENTSDSSENFDTDDELFYQQVKRFKKDHKYQLGSDDDPDPPSELNEVVYPPDRYGWSRNRKTIKLHKFKGASPEGSSVDRPEQDSPLQYFLMFFPLVLFKKMARYTNIAGRSHPRFNKRTTQEEIRAWLGIKMLQGVHHNKSFMDDWSTHPGLRNTLVANTMLRERFCLLSEVLSCANPKKGPKSIQNPQQRWAYMIAQPMYPLQVVWDTVVANCLDNWNPGKQIALDEATMIFKRRGPNSKRFFMPLKPNKMGFKIFTICDAKTGYLLNMLVSPESGFKMTELTLKLTEPFFHRYHELYVRHAITSPALATQLLEKRTYICGPVKKVSKGLPDDFSLKPLVNPNNYKKIAEITSAPRGTMYFRQNGNMTASIWRDCKALYLLSTCHQSYRNKTTDFLGRKGKNETRVTTSSLRAPKQVIDYNKYMGVNRHDQLRSAQSCSRQSMRWWRKLLYFLLDVSRVNAWLCYKEKTKGNPTREILSHRMFVVDIATALIAGFAEGTPMHQHSAQPVPLTNGPKHQLIRMTSPYGKMCVACRRMGRKTAKGKPISTRTGCVACNIHLCKVGCFLEFHSA